MVGTAEYQLGCKRSSQPKNFSASNAPSPVSRERDNHDRRRNQHLGQRHMAQQSTDGAEDDCMHHGIEHPVQAAAGVVRVMPGVGSVPLPAPRDRLGYLSALIRTDPLLLEKADPLCARVFLMPGVVTSWPWSARGS